ncbi:hypothetical protein NE865_11126 [Phthorimaea operculella]|nr:hypothetical protein NE865_11126 [Phthorimaea operculella]
MQKAGFDSRSRPGRPPKRASGVGLSLAATQFPGHPFKKHRLENGDYSPYENGHMSEMARMEKSPLLANGYNAPPTHLGPMGFMHQHALMSPGMQHPGMPRPDGSIIKGQPMHNMEALARLVQLILFFLVATLWLRVVTTISTPGEWVQRTTKASRAHGLHAPARPDVARHAAPGHAQTGRLHHQGTAHAQHGGACKHALMSPGMQHPGMPRPDGSIIKGQPMHNMEALARSGIWENCRAAYEDIVKHLERLRDERGDMERVMAMDKAREGSHNGSSPGHSPVLNLSKSGSGDRERPERGERGDGRGDGSASGRSSAASRRTPQPPRMPSQATAAASPRSHSDESEAPLSDQEDHNVKDEDDGADLSDTERELPASTSPAPVSYAQPQGTPPPTPMDPTAETLVSSTETLLRNIQGLLKVAADNARQQERQISYEKAELKMDVLREREVKDNLERQLLDEQKMRVMYQKRLKKERKQRQAVQEQLETELKRRQKIEEALKQSGAPSEILRIVTDSKPPNAEPPAQSPPFQREPPRTPDKPQWNYPPPPVDIMSGQAAFWQNYSDTSSPGRNGSESKPPSAEPPAQSPPFQREPPRTPDKPQWNYPPPPVDIMSGQAAFWQNYSESLAQELEMERKSRQQAMERDVKSPLSDRAGYYKNSVLFSSAT